MHVPWRSPDGMCHFWTGESEGFLHNPSRSSLGQPEQDEGEWAVGTVAGLEKARGHGTTWSGLCSQGQKWAQWRGAPTGCWALHRTEQDPHGQEAASQRYSFCTLHPAPNTSNISPCPFWKELLNKVGHPNLTQPSGSRWFSATGD